MVGMGGRRSASLAVAAGTLLVAGAVLGGQLLASASGHRPAHPPAPATSSQPADAEDACGPDTDTVCGNDHSRAIHKWVACKAENAKDTCTKPVPPSQARGHAKHAGTPPGPASSDGQGHGWGRAHAPGQLKVKDDPDSDAQDRD
jgi:hypothetical protein